jgi:hypothetical protein
MVNTVGYMGFESPMNLYAPAGTLPTVYTAGCQIRQYGAGDTGDPASQGSYANVTTAWYAPPAAMVTAVAQGVTYAKAATPYVVTKSDIDRYQIYNASGA